MYRHCTARRTVRRKVLGIVAIATALIAAGAWGRGCRAAALPSQLEALIARIEAPGQLDWKRGLIPVIRERKIDRFEARVTYYCPANAADPLGGGAFSAWGDLRLRRGHVAVGTSVRAVPLGSIIYCPGALDHLQITVDTGPGVQGRDRLDFCIPDPLEYRALGPRNGRRYPCWVLGKLGKEQAR